MKTKPNYSLLLKACYLRAFFIAAFTSSALIGTYAPAAALKSSLKTDVRTATERARELVLAGRRMEAVHSLSKVYAHLSTEIEVQTKIEKKPPAASSGKGATRAELLRSWEEIATVFLSDKAQNQYALAESLWLSKPKEAVDLLQAVMPLEIGNLSVALLGARAALRALDCSRAETFSKEAEKIFAPGLEVRLIRLQVQSCLVADQSNLPPLKIVSSDYPVDWGELDSAIRLLLVKDLWRRKDAKGARAAVVAWESQAPEDPEVWFWKWKTSEVSDSKRSGPLSAAAARDRAAARNYLRICNEMTPRRRKIFSVHPELCLATESVESDLKSSEKSGS
jgi:hypothetical protein